MHPTFRLKIDYLQGDAPVRGGGTIDSRPFEFRARGNEWSMTLWNREGDEHPSWSWNEPWGNRWYDASYLALPDAQMIIDSCVAMLESGIAPPRAQVGRPAPEVRARALAHSLVVDVWVYGAEDVRGQQLPPAQVLARQLAESREYFVSECGAAFLPIFEHEVHKLEAYTQWQWPSEVWIYDEISAHAVGTRWSWVLEHTEGARRAEWQATAAQWVEAWTEAGAVRATALQALGARRGAGTC